jgi:hypothetical protein
LLPKLHPTTAKHWFFLGANGACPVLFRAELVTVLHDRVATALINLVQHLRMAVSIFFALRKHLQLVS